VSEHNKFLVFNVEESGEYNELGIEPHELKYYLHPDNVVIIVKEDVRRMYVWKGAQAPVRKRFLASREATSIQGKLMKEGYHRCKIISIDQGDELEEFLNQFGLESMQVKEKMEDKYYIRNKERQELKIRSLLDTKAEFKIPSKLDEIREFLDDNERFLWLKSSKMKVTKNWAKNLMKDKRYKDRVKNLTKADEIEEKLYENRYVITDKRILVHSKLNLLYDFSGIPERFFRTEGEIAILKLEGLDSFEIEVNKGGYDVWINAEPIKRGAGVFIFDGLTQDEYNKFLEIFLNIQSYLPEIPKDLKLKFIRRA